jgi:hypothetical protein
VPTRPDDRELARFAPRVTMMVVLGFALFLLSAGVWVAPALLETPPPGAIEDWRKERAWERMRGKVPWLLTGSFVAATLITIRVTRPKRS